MAALPCLSSQAAAPVISRARGPTARPVTTATRSSAGKRPALLAHGSLAQITLFGAGLAEAQQAEAGAQIGGYLEP